MTPEEQTQINDMRQDIDGIKADVAEIKRALLGDEDFETTGYIAKINDIDKRLKALEETYKAGRWLAIGILISAGYGLKEAWTFFIDLFKGHG